MTDKTESSAGLLRRAARPGRPAGGPGHRQGVQGGPRRRLLAGVSLGVRLMEQDPAEGVWFWKELQESLE